MRLGTIDQATLERAEARLPRWMMGFAVGGAIAALLVAGPRAAGGFALGAAVAMVGYSWLHKAVVSLMNAGRVRPSRMMLGKLLVRYPLAIAVIFVFYRENWLPIEAVVLGLFVPMAGALAESIFQIGAALRHPKAT
ncbi:MAG TPA: ATP synthase subunit I [Terriglobia bacterium]|nr:ATP synthase subunit I [Terriglobia bacterium]